MGDDETLSKLVSGVARSVVETQRILDAAYLEDLDRYAAHLGPLVGAFESQGLGAIVQAVVPPCMRASSFSLEFATQIATRRTVEARIEAKVLNGWWMSRYATRGGQESRICVEVTRQPLGPRGAEQDLNRKEPGDGTGSSESSHQ